MGLFLTGSYTWAANQASPPLPLATGLTGPALMAGEYIFWVDNAGTINARQLKTQATSLIAAGSGSKSNLASDGKTLVWVEHSAANAGAGIRGYNLNSGQIFQIIPASPEREFGGLAFSGNTLYYKDATLGHNGLYSLDLTTSQEQLLSQDGQNPVATAGAVAWTEEKYQGEHLPSQWSLYLLKPGRAQAPVELTSAEGPFQLSLAGNSLVWAARPPATDQRVYLYNLAQSQSRVISGGDANSPVTDGEKVAWVEPPAGNKNNLWSVTTLDLATNNLSSLVTPGSARIELDGFSETGSVALRAYRNIASGTAELYLTQPGQPTLNLAATPLPASATPLIANPLNCGQVYRQGYSLADCNGRWPVNGVQFILPDYGINGQTFHDDNYSASVANGQVDFWLDKASAWLGAKNLRIFVDMPNTTWPGPTSPATLYDFALRASSRGMRLGVVLHNDTSWTLTQPRQQWISQFISYFRDRNALSLLAYLNADNEINNHCGTAPDCYDNNPTYVDKANRWVSDFTAYVKSQNSAILVTVGITTEKANGDSQSAVYDFFRTGGSAPSLASSVDFLSPHNYGGGGYGIWPELRYNLGYQKPIVLEEYGYPTDSLTASTYFKEGPPICQTDPAQAVCYQTAPYFVEVNARSMRDNTTNGYAGGSAWMVADSNNKSCGSPSDFYTGLFASGNYANCGGTATTLAGAPKSTAARIRFHYLGSTTFPPLAPSNLTVQATVPGQLNLNWTDNAANETNFRIERKIGPSGSWAEIATVGANQTGYQNSGLLPGVPYSYRVRAYNTANGGPSYSAYSNEASATTLFPPPTGLSVAAASPIQLNLIWADNSTGETGFRLERKKTSAGTWQEIASLGANSTTYRDVGLEFGTIYYYRVRASSLFGYSVYSGEASASTLATANYLVTNPDGNATGTNDSLAYALNLATAGQSIRLAPAGGVITVSGPLPVWRSGVTLIGSCSGGPGITLNGAANLGGLVLPGNTILYGLKIGGFNGPQLKNLNGGNQLKCVQVLG